MRDRALPSEFFGFLGKAGHLAEGKIVTLSLIVLNVKVWCWRIRGGGW